MREEIVKEKKLWPWGNIFVAFWIFILFVLIFFEKAIKKITIMHCGLGGFNI